MISIMIMTMNTKLKIVINNYNHNKICDISNRDHDKTNDYNDDNDNYDTTKTALIITDKNV